ncbi:MAG: protein kinase domain-containing protein, partial [Thermoleophilaceae bacterium]
MTQQLDTPGLERAGAAAIAAALHGLRTQGVACQAFVPIDGRNVWVTAVHADSEDWWAAAARRAATHGRWLLPVADVGELDGWQWIAYDMGSTTPLSYSREHRLLPTATCLRLLSDVARGLDAAAEDGVFACEVPPESVFVSRRGAWLGDLGTAREALGGSSSGLGGDPGYVAPEVLRGEPAGERSGVYAFGALLYHLLAGASPRLAHSVPLASRRADLSTAMDRVVTAAMAEDPRRRPRSASEAHERATRTLAGETPALRAGRRGPAADEDEPPEASLSWSNIAPLILEPDRERPARPDRVEKVRPRPKPASPTPDAPTPKRAAARSKARPPKPASPPRPRISVSGGLPHGRLLAVAVAGSLVLGSAAGLLLAQAADPEPARAQVVDGGGIAVTMPPGWRAAGSGAGLSVRDSESSLEARLDDGPFERHPDSRPVRLGRLQAWRAAAPGVVRYAVPTTEGAVLITCRARIAPGAGPLRRCERTASTLRLRTASALPLASVVEEEERLRAAIAALSASRDTGRRRLAGAVGPSGQRAAAQA